MNKSLKNFLFLTLVLESTVLLYNRFGKIFLSEGFSYQDCKNSHKAAQNKFGQTTPG
jgi:hypothetical protein